MALNPTDAPRRIVLARRPQGVPRPADFRLEPAPDAPLREGDCQIANCLLSMDPAIRGFLDDRPSYLPPVAIGETVRGMSLGQVIRSRNPTRPEGCYLRALSGWEDLSVLAPDAVGLESVHPVPGIALDAHMGALGPAGLTAWVGLHEIGRIKAGQTVLISAAAGAVGSLAGQIARLRGCRTIGIVGSAAKAARLRTLGFHAAVNYRDVEDLAGAIRAACPDGIDLYFDNVGGATLETVLPLMNVHGSVVVCGMIADYNHQDDPHAVRTLWQLVVKRLTLRGFLTYEHPQCIPQAQAELDDWVRSGSLVGLGSVYEGLEAAPAAFIDLMSGRTMGKTLVRMDYCAVIPPSTVISAPVT
jgi:NADPH-dependent curcumin reductase CurA